MLFETFAPTVSGTFYPVDPELGTTRNSKFFLLPIVDLGPSAELFAEEFPTAALVPSNFHVSSVTLGSPDNRRSDDPVAFLFYSRLPVKNYFTGLLSYSRSWQRTAMQPDTGLTDATLVLKTPHFYMYHSPNKATLVTCGSLSDKLHEFLTMI